jgi:hypothetical protein
MNNLSKSQKRQLSKEPIYSVGQPLLSNALGELIIDLEGLDSEEFSVPEQINSEIIPVQQEEEVITTNNNDEEEDKIQGVINHDEENIEQEYNDEEIFNSKPFEPQHQYSTRSRGPVIQPEKIINHQSNIILAKSVFNISLSKGKKLFGEEKANSAALSEIKQLVDFKVFEPVYFNSLTLEEKKSVIYSSLFLKEKFDAAGVFEKLKGRIVGGGNDQDKSIYSDSEISSPTVSVKSVFLCSSIAAAQKRKVATIDVVGAYLNADMVRKVLMKLQKDVVELLVQIMPQWKSHVLSDGTMVVLLKKALYGCVESGKLWYDHLCKFLEIQDFTKNPYDPCVFNCGSGDNQVTVLFHVDDIMVTSVSEQLVQNFVKSLVIQFKNIKVKTGSIHNYLAMTFDFGLSKRVSITMNGYIEELMKEYNISNSKPSPASNDLFHIDESSPLLSQEKKEIFHSMAASALFPAKRVKPEILLAVSFLCGRVHNPTEQDWNKIIRLFQYINGSKDRGIILRMDKNLELKSMIDASFGCHPESMLSHAGGADTLGAGYHDVRSSKQKLVTKSSTESEIVGVTDHSPQPIHSRNFLIAQGFKMNPLIICQDNQSTIALLNKGRSTAIATRHINCRHFFIHNRIKTGEVKLQYIPTQDMVADILTKPLQGEQFIYLRDLLTNWNDNKP